MFFERNGLQHYEFCLEKGQSIVSSIQWSPNSEILAVLLKFQEAELPVLQLWFRGNYHWYLKQELKYDQRVCSFSWDNDPQKMRLHVFVKGK